MGTIVYTTTLTKTSCGVCNIPFAMPTSMYESVLETGNWFYCPNGHRIHYFETENDRLRKEVETARRQREWATARADRIRQEKEATDRSLAATKGVVTKMRKRSGHGVCPVQGCKRHFKNLQDHMASEHPDFKDA